MMNRLINHIILIYNIILLMIIVIFFKVLDKTFKKLFNNNNIKNKQFNKHLNNKKLVNIK
jgi:Na+/phosphate symporter